MTTEPLTIEIETERATQVIDITDRVDALLGGTAGGSCLL